MKKFLSLIMVAAMLVAVFAMVGCKGDEETTESTTVATTTEATTEAPVETTTEAPVETTTEAPVETTTEAPVETTTEAPVETTTAAPVETTTAAPVETTTAAPVETTTGATLGIFDRFDFGTASKAQDAGETSHEYIVANLAYNASRIAVEWTEDTVKIYATKTYDSGASRDDYALRFDDIVTYDFDDELIPGYGSWSNAPLNPNYNSWQGKMQYCKVRILNNTTNNVISMHWHRAGEGFATTTASTSMYLQGGAPATTSEHNLTTEATTEWAEYYYDMVFLSAVGREINYTGKTSYMQVVNEAKSNNKVAQNNWNGSGIVAINFHFLGAYGKDNINDTRKNIKMGMCVEVDYVVFGSSIEQLEGYTSYLEDAAA
jgi:hypothetical protein